MRKPERIFLTDHEVLGSGIGKIKKYLGAELGLVLGELEGFKGEVATAILRGRIFEIRRILAVIEQREEYLERSGAQGDPLSSLEIDDE